MIPRPPTRGKYILSIGHTLWNMSKKTLNFQNLTKKLPWKLGMGVVGFGKILSAATGERRNYHEATRRSWVRSTLQQGTRQFKSALPSTSNEVDTTTPQQSTQSRTSSVLAFLVLSLKDNARIFSVTCLIGTRLLSLPSWLSHALVQELRLRPAPSMWFLLIRISPSPVYFSKLSSLAQSINKR